MSSKHLYVPVVEDDALDLAEDISKIQMAKHCINQLSTLTLSKDTQWKVLSILGDWERELRSVLRNEYLYAEHKAKPISQSLRDRLKYELYKELNMEGDLYDPEDRRDRQDSTSVDKGATSYEGRERWDEPPF